MATGRVIVPCANGELDRGAARRGGAAPQKKLECIINIFFPEYFYCSADKKSVVCSGPNSTNI